MKQALIYFLASVALCVLLVLTITIGLETVIPFESFWAEIAFMSVLFLGACVFLYQAISITYDNYKDTI